MRRFRFNCTLFIQGAQFLPSLTSSTNSSTSQRPAPKILFPFFPNLYLSVSIPGHPWEIQILYCLSAFISVHPWEIEIFTCLSVFISVNPWEIFPLIRGGKQPQTNTNNHRQKKTIKFIKICRYKQSG